MFGSKDGRAFQFESQDAIRQKTDVETCKGGIITVITAQLTPPSPNIMMIMMIVLWIMMIVMMIIKTTTIVMMIINTTTIIITTTISLVPKRNV